MFSGLCNEVFVTCSRPEREDKFTSFSCRYRWTRWWQFDNWCVSHSCRNNVVLIFDFPLPTHGIDNIICAVSYSGTTSSAARVWKLYSSALQRCIKYSPSSTSTKYYLSGAPRLETPTFDVVIVSLCFRYNPSCNVANFNNSENNNVLHREKQSKPLTLQLVCLLLCYFKLNLCHLF